MRWGAQDLLESGILDGHCDQVDHAEALMGRLHTSASFLYSLYDIHFSFIPLLRLHSC